MAAAKEADRLLNVKGVSASFALVVVDNVVHISGRSDGSVNVQLILERLGGGGHLTMAGAQLNVSFEEAEMLVKSAAEEFILEEKQIQQAQQAKQAAEKKSDTKRLNMQAEKQD